MRKNVFLEKLETMGDSADDTTRKLASMYQSVFSTTEGQLVLEDLKQCFFYYDTTLDERFSEANEGNRQVLLYILKALEIDVSKPIDSANP